MTSSPKIYIAIPVGVEFAFFFSMISCALNLFSYPDTVLAVINGKTNSPTIRNIKNAADTIAAASGSNVAKEIADITSALLTTYLTDLAIAVSAFGIKGQTMCPRFQSTIATPPTADAARSTSPIDGDSANLGKSKWADIPCAASPVERVKRDFPFPSGYAAAASECGEVGCALICICECSNRT